MRRLKKWMRVAGVLLVLGVVAFFVIRNYVVRRVILAEVRKQYGGRVELGDWWLDGKSAGVTGVALGESDRPDSPTWLAADRISTDLSIGRLLRGQFLPTRVVVEHPKVSLRFDKDGKLATAIPFRGDDKAAAKPGSEPFAIPIVDVRRAEVTIAQDGRAPFRIARADAQLEPKGGREVIAALTDDPVWGHARINGDFAPDFQSGSVTIQSGPGFVADREEVKKIPFVPAEVWQNLETAGPVDATVRIALDAKATPPVHVLTKLRLNGAWAKLDPLQVETADTTGEITIDDAKVTIDPPLRGKAINGTLRAAGTLDFAQNPPDLNIDLRVRGMDVTRTPAAWQLDKLGATGLLTGKVGLRARIGGDGVDLTGTTGRAVIENGSLQGIPIKEVSVNLKAEGNDLQFDTSTSGQPVNKAELEANPTVPTFSPLPPIARRGGKPGPGAPPAPKPAEPTVEKLLEPALAALPLARLVTGDDGFLGFVAFGASELLERRTSKSLTPPTSRLRLPKSITTRIALEDVELATILAKVERFGIKVKFPIRGRLTINATATIPLDAFQNLKGYVIHGDAKLTNASIDYVDLGELAAHLDVEDGVVNLGDFRGVLVDRPADGGPPPSAPIPPKDGPLPEGGFRANLRAEIAPKGMATAKVEGYHLPLGELFAPFLPVPTPLSGDVSIQAEAGVNLASLSDPRAYTLVGDLESRRIAYKKARLDRVASKFAIRDGKATIDELSALLKGKPLQVRADLALSAPYTFHAASRVDDWELADLVDFVPPELVKLPEIAGRLDANSEASGTILPFTLQTQGGARIAAIKVGPVPARYVVTGWKTERGVIVLEGLEAAIFGGKITGDARIPTKLGSPLDANLVLKGIDTRELTASLPSKAVGLTGVADGRVKVTVPPNLAAADAEVDLTAPDLWFRPEGQFGAGIKVESLQATARLRDRLLSYQASAQSLGAKLLFNGSAPFDPADPLKAVAQAEARAVGFRLGDAWRGLGMSGGLAELEGTGAFDANLRGTVEPPQLWSRALFEMRDLRYGPRLPIGTIKGLVTVSPTAWKLDEVEGALFGGLATGSAQGVVRSGALGASSFTFAVNRAAVPKLLAAAPILAKGSSGYGTLRATGRLDESLHVAAQVDIPRAEVLGLTLTDVRLPTEINISPGSGFGMAQARRWTGRLAGGSIDGKAWMRLGQDRAYQSDIRLAGVDLEVLSRIGAISSKAKGGKVSGTLTMSGPDPEDVAKAHGRFNFDIDDATLVQLPVFRELDRFMGAARGGGLFEDGDASGNIANETVYIERLTLNGRVIQLHAIGSVTFRGGLNLEVLVNTNQIIPQSGLALLNIVPGLGEAVGQSEKVLLKLGSFLSSKLLKFRVTGSVQNPVVQLDPGIDVGNSAAGFFSSVLQVPGGRR